MTLGRHHLRQGSPRGMSIAQSCTRGSESGAHLLVRSRTGFGTSGLCAQALTDAPAHVGAVGSSSLWWGGDECPAQGQVVHITSQLVFPATLTEPGRSYHPCRRNRLSLNTQAAERLPRFSVTLSTLIQLGGRETPLLRTSGAGLPGPVTSCTGVRAGRLCASGLPLTRRPCLCRLGCPQSLLCHPEAAAGGGVGLARGPSTCGHHALSPEACAGPSGTLVACEKFPSYPFSGHPIYVSAPCL